MTTIICGCMILSRLLISCHDLPPDPGGSSIQLSVEDVSCTEAYIRLRVPAGPFPQMVDLYRDGALLRALRLGGSDTVLLEEGLQPRRTYIYQAKRFLELGLTEESDPVPVSTLDTTSHEMTWVVTPLGDGDASALNDVVVVSDSVAYAVGEIYFRDSLGNWDPNAFNLARWDGMRWQLSRLHFEGWCSPVRFPRIHAVCSVSENTLIASLGGSIGTFDGTSTSLDCSVNGLLTGSIRGITKTANGEIFGVGYLGNILRKTGGAWSRVESGTTIDLETAVAATSSAVWVSGIDRGTWQRSTLLRVVGSAVTKVYEFVPPLPPAPDPSRLTGLIVATHAWGPRSVLVLTTHGIYQAPSTTTGNARLLWSPERTIGFLQAARGQGANDFFAVGDFTTILHYNGKTFHLYSELIDFTDPDPVILRSCSIKGNLFVGVGYKGDRAVAIVGRRSRL